MQLLTIKRHTVTVAASAVGQHQNAASSVVLMSSQTIPPSPQGIGRQLAGVRTGRQVNQARVGNRIVNAVGNRLCGFRIGPEIVVKSLQRSVSPSSAATSKAADEFLFLRVDADDRPAQRFVLASKFGDAVKLLLAKFAAAQWNVLGDLSAAEPEFFRRDSADHPWRRMKSVVQQLCGNRSQS